MLTKPTNSSNFLFQTLWSKNADDIFVVAVKTRRTSL